MSGTPVAVDDVFDFSSGAVISGNILTNDYDPDGDPVFLRFFDGVRVNAKQSLDQETLIAGDYGMFRVRPDGTFSYELNAGVTFAPGQTLTERLTVKISDGGGHTNVSTLVLHIHDNVPGNAVPVAQDVTYSGDEDHAITAQLPASDPDNDMLSYTIVGDGPAHGTVSAGSEGIFTYIPAPDWFGTDSFTYRVSDGTSIDTATVTLNVAQLFDDPIVNVTGSGDSSSFGHAISDDGTTIALVSFAGNLVPGDTSFTSDIFLYDIATRQFQNITLEGNERSLAPTLSADGSRLAFESWASNLTPGDTNGWHDIFLFDTASGQLTNVTRFGNGHSVAPSLSADGTLLAFQSGASNLTPDDTSGSDIFLYNVTAGTFTNITKGGNNSSLSPILSADGSTIVFESFASNLTPGDTFNTPDLFLYDVASGHLTNVTLAGHGTGFDNSTGYAASLSADGTRLAFQSMSTSLIPGDMNGFSDIFVYDNMTGQITNITQGSDGRSFVPGLSSDGSTLAFVSFAKNLTSDAPDSLWDVFRYDFASGQFDNVTAGAGVGLYNGSSGDPALSADGSRMIFDSFANNLTPGDSNGFSDLFLYYANELI
jgi:VCBS repeat-containing protein